MAKLIIDIGTSPNKGDGDPIRTAFQKINANFNELYAGGFADPANLGTSLLPDADATYDLGSTSKQWGDIHVADFIYLGGVRIEVNSNGALLVGGSNPIQTNDIQGSVFGDDSTLLVDGVNGKITGEVTGTISSTNWMASSDNYLTIANGGSTGPGPIQIVASANLDLTAGAGHVINANRNIVAAGGVTGDLTGNTFGEHTGEVVGNVTGDVKGSVFADDSTLLVDGVNGVIPKANVESSTDWDTAFSWGDHAAAGYLTSETDSQTLSLVGTNLSITNGNTVDLSSLGGGATSLNDLSDVDTATIAPSRSMQPLIWDDIDQNWYPGNGISLTGNLTMEDNSFIMLRENAYLNFEGTSTDGFDTQFSVVNPTANRTIRLPDADGTVALTGQALSSFNNDLDYAGIVGSTIQANGLPTGTTFTDTLTLPVLTAEPSSPVNGMVAVADGTSWDPMSNAAQTMVVYLAGAWRQIAQGGV